MAFEKCSCCGEMVASLKRHFCMGKSSGRSDEAKAREVKADVGGSAPRSPQKRNQAGVGSERTSSGDSDGDRPKAIKPSVGLASGVMQNTATCPSEIKSKRGRPRIGEQRTKPWEALNMSERTYYRRQAKGETE